MRTSLFTHHTYVSLLSAVATDSWPPTTSLLYTPAMHCYAHAHDPASSTICTTGYGVGVNVVFSGLLGAVLVALSCPECYVNNSDAHYVLFFFFLMKRPPPRSPLFPYTTLSR